MYQKTSAEAFNKGTMADWQGAAKTVHIGQWDSVMVEVRTRVSNPTPQYDAMGCL